MSPEATRFMFGVRYDDRILRAAAWAYIRHAAVGRRTWLLLGAFALAVGGIGVGVAAKGWTVWSGLALGVLIVYPLVVATGYGLHLRALRAKVRRMDAPVAQVLIGDDDIEINADSGGARLPLRLFSGRIEHGGVMLLAMSGSQFVTLPLRDAPAAAQDFLRKRIAVAS